MPGSPSPNGRSHGQRSPAEVRLIEAFRVVGEALADALAEVRRAVERPAAPPAAPKPEYAERLVGVTRAAELLGVSERHVRSMLDSGALPRVKLGQRVLIDLADLNKLIAGHKEHSGREAQAGGQGR